MLLFDFTAFFLSLIAGDILIFMPGQEDIEVTCETLKGIEKFSAVQSSLQVGVCHVPCARCWCHGFCFLSAFTGLHVNLIDFESR